MQVCNLTVKSWASNWPQIVLTVTSGRAPTHSEPLPSVVFFSAARQMTGSYLKLGHDYFLGFIFQLFSYHVAICVFVWDAFGTICFIFAQEDHSTDRHAVPDLRVPRLRPIRWSRRPPGRGDHTTSIFQIPGSITEQWLSEGYDIVMWVSVVSMKVRPSISSIQERLSISSGCFSS